MAETEYTPTELKWQAEAQAEGLTWLKQTRTGHGLFRFNDCAHEQEIQNNHVRRGYFKCQICLEQKLKNEAEVEGLTWLKQTRKGHGLFRFNDCGHEQEIRNGHIRNGAFKCQTCFEQKLKDEALAVGLTWLKQTRRAYGLFRFNDCGHDQEIDNGQIRKGAFKCQTCNDTWATKPSDLYILLITLQGEVIVKIGISNNLDHRMTRYGLPPDAEVQILKTVSFATGLEAKAAETKLLKKFEAHKLKSINHIMTKSGGTECFCPSVLAQILDAAGKI